MVDTIGNVGTGSVAATKPAATVAAANFSADSQPSTNQSGTSSANASLAPRLKIDPVAGLITQYFDPSGNVSSQVPSVLVLSYLRAGLTQDGTQRPAIAGLQTQVTA